MPTISNHVGAVISQWVMVVEARFGANPIDSNTPGFPRRSLVDSGITRTGKPRQQDSQRSL